ncbi:hypothetical protein F2P56_028186 [Juglans regia]|uniref:Uncharacterized protein n=2 Tax=Juglans regia TaxID=51240 RepID=A0A833T5K4_JUGRE|nr:uncharacterized protein LOC109009898 [Juglans regia]KAF5453271.1 hypothetical protein F2P56_028186 [Juglans regia]
MSDDEDDWVKNAMTDDSLVADLLLRLNPAPRPPRPPRVPDRPPLNIDWTVRQRRSKSVPTQDEDGNNKTATERASPTTPLSWSGATCASGGEPDGFEESSRPAKTTNGSRSKVAPGGETTTTKRPRKKKSIAELKEEESVLTKERRNLKNQLAAIRLSFEKQRAANKSLKKIKGDLQSSPETIKAITTMASTEAVTDRPQKMEEDCKPTAISPSDLALITDLNALKHPSQPNGASTIQEVGERDASFMLPDLNLTFEEA